MKERQGRGTPAAKPPKLRGRAVVLAQLRENRCRPLVLAGTDDPSRRQPHSVLVIRSAGWTPGLRPAAVYSLVSERFGAQERLVQARWLKDP